MLVSSVILWRKQPCHRAFVAHPHCFLCIISSPLLTWRQKKKVHIAYKVIALHMSIILCWSVSRSVCLSKTSAPYNCRTLNPISFKLGTIIRYDPYRFPGQLVVNFNFVAVGGIMVSQTHLVHFSKNSPSIWTKQLCNKKLFFTTHPFPWIPFSSSTFALCYLHHHCQFFMV